MKTVRVLTTATAVLSVANLFSNGAVAAIDCFDQFQYSGGRLIETPYCSDGYLAAIAREYGAYVSADAIRNNPNKKERICRFVGYDWRLTNACSGYRPQDNNRR